MDFIASLRSTDTETRIDAASELMVCGDECQHLAHEVLFALADEDEEVRELTAGFLEELGPPSAKALPSLIQQASSMNTLVSYWAITLIGRLGSDATDATAQLNRIADDSTLDSELRSRASWALERIKS